MKQLMPCVFNGADDKTDQSVIDTTKKISEVCLDIETNIPPSRERSLALTKLEEAHFWLAASRST